jgi:hypothetical protein
LNFVDTVARLRDGNPALAKQFPQFFLYLTFPWVADQALLGKVQQDVLQRRKLEIKALNFDGDATRKQLEQVLANDKHLVECCPSLFHLVNFLDLFFITPVADAKRQGTSQERLDFAYDEFESLTYHQGRFKRVALSHLFNFDMEGDSILFEGNPMVGNIRIERLDAGTIPSILGESGFQAFLHPPGIGDCFAVEEEGVSGDDDISWLVKKREKALTFAQVLQYFKDGIVHIGYSVPVFQPNWVNQIRRSGLFFLGEPRRAPYENGQKIYKVGSDDKDNLKKWWKMATMSPILDHLANKKGKLRQAIYRAGQYYESSHSRADNVERLLALAIAVESLFSPNDKGELRFRIAQSIAQFIGGDPEERERVFKSIGKMYDRRSALVHGSYDVDQYDEGKFVSALEIEEWSSFVRRALLGFLTIYFRGNLNAEREPLLTRIVASHLDEAKAKALRNESDIERLFQELAKV